jgi:hypothetical protein
MNLEFSDKRRNQIALVFLGISWCALAVLSAQGIFGYPFRSVFTLDSENFVAAGPQLWERDVFFPGKGKIALFHQRQFRSQNEWQSLQNRCAISRITMGLAYLLERVRGRNSILYFYSHRQAECIVRLAPAQRFDSGIGCRVYRKMACNDSLHSLHLPSDFLPTFVEGCRRDSSADAAGQCGEY